MISATRDARCISLSFVAVSMGDPIDMMKPPTRSVVISRSTRSQLACPSGVKSPNNCGHTSCAARSRGDNEARTESTHCAAGASEALGKPVPGVAEMVGAQELAATVSVAIATTRLPADRTLLARVDILGRARSKEKCLHVLGQEAPRLRIHDVEPVMVDQHGLLTNPLTPAILADLRYDTLADGAGKRCALESGTRLPASDTLHIGHDGNRLRADQDRAYSTFASRRNCRTRM